MSSLPNVAAPHQRAFAVAIEQAVQAVQRQVPQRIAARLESVYPAGFELLDGGKSYNPYVAEAYLTHCQRVNFLRQIQLKVFLVLL